MLTLLKGILGDAEEKEYTLGDAHSSRKELTRCLGKRDEAWAMLILLKGILGAAQGERKRAWKCS
ncbi:hypothetical protein DY000_02030311 [Brassica cretica]|uniref:Uncharacterized protein n=1 Tax=Brassica cretica TaxID=69181 RepID=A0ABQ7DL78_BRACR|nr:hypothetical protein DY000_02030311 [Brassica cretica]